MRWGDWRARLRSVPGTAFIWNVGLLASGTIIGQAIMVLVLPVLTRLYEPEAFGALGIFMSITVVASVAACLRLDIAIPLPDRDEDALNLVVLGLGFATVLALVAAVLLVLAGGQFIDLSGHREIADYLFLVPLGMWLAAAYSAVQFWSIRKKRFGQVATTQLTRAIGGSATQVGLGIAGLASFGLVVGYVIYTALGTVGLVYHFFRFDRGLLSFVSASSLRRVLHENRRFPYFSVPESLLNSAAINLPVVLIGALAGPKEAGYMLLAQRVTSIPVGLLGGSLSRVFLAEAAERRRNGELGSFTRVTMKRLAQVGAFPFFVVALVSPILFPYIFGPDWERAGVMVTWMVPFMFVQFAVSPVSTSLHATGNQLAAFLLQLCGFVIVFGAILLGAFVDPYDVFYWFAGASLVYYTLYALVVYRVSRT